MNGVTWEVCEMHFHDIQIFGYLVYVHCSKPISEAYPSVLGNADDVPAAFLCPFHTSIYGSNELEHGIRPLRHFPLGAHLTMTLYSCFICCGEQI